LRDYIIDINELSDSRELLEAKPPRVIKIFIYFVVGMLTITFVWISLFSIEITVKSPGIVRPVQDISVVKNIVSGAVKKINFTDGQEISKGDLLYSIETSSIDIEYDQVLSRIDRLETRKINLNILKDSIFSSKNGFKESEINFYNRYLNYQLEMEKLNITYLKSLKEFNIENELLDSMKTKSKFEELESTLKFNKLNMDAYKSSSLVSIENELNSTVEELLSLKKSKLKYEEDLKLCSITASIDGVIQKIQDLNIDDYIGSGSEVLRIIPKKSDSIKVDIMVSNKDIAGINKGDSVKYIFSALPQREFGVIEGTITSLPGDISTTNNSNVYMLEACVNSRELEDKYGESVFIKSGMYCETRIITREQKIIYYLLEKLDFKI